jgi:hypothetical protein
MTLGEKAKVCFKVYQEANPGWKEEVCEDCEELLETERVGETKQ